MFLLAILIPACASSGPAFLMMYSAYKLNKQGDNIQPWIQIMSSCFLAMYLWVGLYALVYSLAGAATTKYHTLGGLENRNLFPHSSGG